MRRIVTPPVVADLAERMETATRLYDVARAMNMAQATIAPTARTIIAAMRANGTLGLCPCGRERFHMGTCRGSTAAHARYRTPEHLAKRADIIARIMAGDTFAAIADRCGIGLESTRSYLRYLTPAQRERRKAMEQTRYARRVGAGALRLNRDPLYASIAAAVPRWLSEATRDDAISDLYLAVLEGSLGADDVAAEARRYATKAVSQWESRFGPRSLDELAFEDGRETWADMLADPETLEPLEHRLSA